MPVSSPLSRTNDVPKMSDQVAALRFAVGLPQKICEDALARCGGDTAKAERLLRSVQPTGRVVLSAARN